MKLRLETKEILWGTLFGIMFSVIIVFIGFLMIAGMSGCTTTEKQKLIDKISSEVKEVVIDNTKPETKIEDPNVNQQTEETTAVETPQGTTETLDAFPLSELTINVSVDSPQLIRHYTNGWTTEHPWGLIKDLPVTVTIKKFDASGIELDGVKQGKYENERWERTSTFWAFDENGIELGYADNAAVKYPEPGIFYGKAKYILVVSCSDYNGFNATGRSRVMEVK